MTSRYQLKILFLLCIINRSLAAVKVYRNNDFNEDKKVRSRKNTTDLNSQESPPSKTRTMEFNPSGTDYPNDYSKVCGNKWQQKYMDLHNGIISGNIQGKYIVSLPVHAGLADVMLGYVSSFLWALLTNSAFLIARIDSFYDNTTRIVEFGYHSPFM